MNLAARLFLVILISAFVSCAPMPVKVLRDTSYDLASQRTYKLIPNEQDELTRLTMEKSTIDSIVTESIATQLNAKGYQKSSETPDVFVSYYLVTNAKTDTYVVNDYYSQLGYQSLGRSSTRDSFHLQESTYEEGIIIIDIIDAASMHRVWQGFLTSRMDVFKNDERKEQRLRKSVVKILNFLPGITDG